MIGVVTPTSPLSKPQSLSFSNVNVFKHSQTSPLSNSPSPFFNPLDPPAPTRFLTLLSLSFSHHPSLPSFFNSHPTAFQPYQFPTPRLPPFTNPSIADFQSQPTSHILRQIVLISSPLRVKLTCFRSFWFWGVWGLGGCKGC